MPGGSGRGQGARRSARAGSSSLPAARTGTSGCGTSPRDPDGRDDGDRGPGHGPVVQRERQPHSPRRNAAETPNCGPSPPRSRPAPRWRRRVRAGERAGLQPGRCRPAGAGALATGDGNGAIQLWDPAGFHQSVAPISTGTPESAAAASGHAPAVLGGRGDVLAVSDGEARSGCGTPLTRRPIGQPIVSHHAVTGLALNRDSRTLAVVAHGLQLWSTATGQRIGGPLSAAGDAGGPVAVQPGRHAGGRRSARTARPGCGRWPPSRRSGLR